MINNNTHYHTAAENVVQCVIGCDPALVSECTKTSLDFYSDCVITLSAEPPLSCQILLKKTSGKVIKTVCSLLFVSLLAELRHNRGGTNRER